MVGLVLTCFDIHGTIFCVESSSVVEHTHWAAHTLVLPFFIRFFTMVTCLAVLAIRALIAFVICRRSFDVNGLGHITWILSGMLGFPRDVCFYSSSIIMIYNICSTKTTLWKTIVGHCPINAIRYRSYLYSTKRAHSSTSLIKDEGSTQFPTTVWASWSWRHVLPCTWSVHKNEIIDAVSRQLCIQFYTKSWPFLTSTKENSTTKEQKSVKPGQAKLLDDSDDKLNVRQMLHHRGNRLFCYVEQLPGHTQNEQKCPSTCQPQPHRNTANKGNSKTLRQKTSKNETCTAKTHNPITI